MEALVEAVQVVGTTPEIMKKVFGKQINLDSKFQVRFSCNSARYFTSLFSVSSCDFQEWVQLFALSAKNYYF